MWYIAVYCKYIINLKRKLNEKDSIKETQYITSQIETIKALSFARTFILHDYKNTNWGSTEVNPGIIDELNSPPGDIGDVIDHSPLLLHQD